MKKEEKNNCFFRTFFKRRFTISKIISHINSRLICYKIDINEEEERKDDIDKELIYSVTLSFCKYIITRMDETSIFLHSEKDNSSALVGNQYINGDKYTIYANVIRG